MTQQGLAFISKTLSDAGINYAFGEWNGSLVYPYFVGEYTEISSASEYGETESLFMLTGTTDGSCLSLEKAKEKLYTLFSDTGITHVFPDNDGIAVMYSEAFYIPTGTVKYKRMQINLKIKEWRGN